MPLPRDVVWGALADLGSHAVWMRDAESISFVSDQRRGPGTRMEVRTVVGPLRTVDILEVVRWDEGRLIEVEHQGLIGGTGVLGVADADEGTLVTWVETLEFPWWLGGILSAWLARPLLAAIWRGNLQRLEETLSLP